MRFNKIISQLKESFSDKKFRAEAIPWALIAVYLYGVFLHSFRAAIASVFSAGTPTAVHWDWNPVTAVCTVLSPYGLAATVVIIGIAFIFSPRCREWLSGEKIERDPRGFEILSDGLHGTGGWMPQEQQEKILEIGPVEQLAEAPLGKLDETCMRYIALRDMAYSSGHIMVYGASGSGKTRGYTIPFLMKKLQEKKESQIVVDPKGTIFERTYLYAKRQGFTVRVLNVLDMEHSDGFNCFDNVAGDSALVNIIAEAIIATTSSKTEKADFWGKAEKNLLMAMIQYVATMTDPRTGELLPLHERSLGVIYHILATESVTQLDDRFAQLSASHPAQAPYGIFKQAGRTIWGNIIVGLGNRLSTFQNPLVDKITCYNDIDLTLPGKTPCVYYCIISDHDSSMEFLSSIFFSLMFTRLMTEARLHGVEGKLPVRVNMVLEEFCNIYIADAAQLLSVVRSRNIACILQAQGLPSLMRRYPGKEWEEIIQNCSTQIVMGVNDVTTAEYISKKSGMLTVRQHSTMAPQLPIFSYIRGAGNARYSHSQSEGQRPLLYPDEVTMLDKRNCLALIGGYKPLMLYKIVPEDLPGYNELKVCLINQYTPRWSEFDKQRLAKKTEERPPCPAQEAAPEHPARIAGQQTQQTRFEDIWQMPESTVFHYELPKESPEPSPAAPAERLGNMRRYSPKEIKAGHTDKR